MTDTAARDELLQEAQAVLAKAKKRGGPKTAAGKEAVSKNAVTHGITSPSPVAGGEDPAAWETFRQGFVDYFQPVGMPQEEIVDIMAQSHWRKRRVVRREVAIINARRDALEEDALLKTPYATPGEEVLASQDCDIAGALNLLRSLDTLDADTELDPKRSTDLRGLIICMGFARKVEQPTEDSAWRCGPTAGAHREWLSTFAKTQGTTYDKVVQRTLQRGQAALDRQALRTQVIERDRVERERASIMPSPQEMDSLVRYEAHLDRQFARHLSHFELLKRIQNGECLPPPDRLEVTIN